MLGGLTIYLRVANFLQCISAKNYENWLAVDKVIAKKYQAYFFGPPCIWVLSNNVLLASVLNESKLTATYVLCHLSFRVDAVFIDDMWLAEMEPG